MTLQNALKSFDFSDSGLFITYETNEGDLTITDDIELGHGGILDNSKAFATAIRKGDFVKISANDRVAKAAVTESIFVGIAHINARPGKGTKLIRDKDDGDGPFSNVFREVIVEVFADFQRTFTRGTGAAPALAQSVIHSATATEEGQVIGKASLTNTNFCTRFTATEVTILIGYHGKWDI